MNRSQAYVTWVRAYGTALKDYRVRRHSRINTHTQTSNRPEINWKHPICERDFWKCPERLDYIFINIILSYLCQRASYNELQLYIANGSLNKLEWNADYDKFLFSLLVLQLSVLNGKIHNLPALFVCADYNMDSDNMNEQYFCWMKGANFFRTNNFQL